MPKDISPCFSNEELHCIKAQLLTSSARLQDILGQLDYLRSALDRAQESTPELDACHFEIRSEMWNIFWDLDSIHQLRPGSFEDEVARHAPVVNLMQKDVSRLMSRANGELASVERQMKTLRSSKINRGKAGPPCNAIFFLYVFLEKRNREEAVGDALEDYSRYVKRLGKTRADIVFCVEVARCAWPFVKRVISRSGTIVFMAELVRRLTH